MARKRTISGIFFGFLVFVCVSFVYADHAININAASLEELDTLPGVGPSTAQSIIDNRPYASIEEISRANGIGEPGSSSYEEIKGHITVGSASSQSGAQAAQPTDGETRPPASVSPAVSSYVEPPTSDIFANAGTDRTVIVGADVELAGRAYNKKGESLDGVRFVWNFGDGGTAEGERALHHWSYPGRYAITLDIAEGKNAASHRIIVTAEPAKLLVSIGSGGAIIVKNDSGRDLDLSRWFLVAGGKTFALPVNTIILRGAEVAFSPAITGLNQILDGTVGLQYPNGVFAVRAGETHDSLASVQTTQQTKQVVSALAVQQSVVQAPVSDSVAEEEVDEIEEAELRGASTSPQLALSGTQNAGSYVWWLLGAALVSFLGAGAAYAFRRKESYVSSDYGDGMGYEQQANGASWKIIDESVK